jgi:hypothetical protein
MKLINLGVIFVGVWVLFIPITASACTCDLPSPGKTAKQLVFEARKQATAVFAGEVVEVIADPQMGYLKVKLRVEKLWKGVLTNEVIVVTGRGGGDCGYRLEVGARYLMFAYGDEVKLETNICQRTKGLAHAVEDLKLLGKGKLPTTL